MPLYGIHAGLFNESAQPAAPRTHINSTIPVCAGSKEDHASRWDSRDSSQTGLLFVVSCVVGCAGPLKRPTWLALHGPKCKSLKGPAVAPGETGKIIIKIILLRMKDFHAEASRPFKKPGGLNPKSLAGLSISRGPPHSAWAFLRTAASSK